MLICTVSMCFQIGFSRSLHISIYAYIFVSNLISFSNLSESTRFMDLFKMLMVERLPHYLGSGMKACITLKVRAMET